MLISARTSRQARPALVAGHPGRRPVIVVRDVDRHPWQQDAVAAVLAACDRGVVVDVGYPSRGRACRRRRPGDDVRGGARQSSRRGRAAARQRRLDGAAPRPRRCGRDRIDRARPTAARSDWAGRPETRPAHRRPRLPRPRQPPGARARLRLSRARSHPASSAASARGPSTRIRLTRPIPGQSSARLPAPRQRPRERDVRDRRPLEHLRERRICRRATAPFGRVHDEPVRDRRRSPPARRSPTPARRASGRTPAGPRRAAATRSSRDDVPPCRVA